MKVIVQLYAFAGLSWARSILWCPLHGHRAGLEDVTKGRNLSVFAGN
jgi:hypothetical protein